MKKFAQLMLLFTGREVLDARSIFWCSPSQRKTVALLNITDKREKGKRKFKSLFTRYLQTATSKATYPLQSNAVPLQSLCKVKPLKEMSIYLLTLLYLHFMRIQTIYFLFNMFITYQRNKYDNNCFFRSVLGILPLVIAQTSPIGLFLRPWVTLSLF